MRVNVEMSPGVFEAVDLPEDKWAYVYAALSFGLVGFVLSAGVLSLFLA